MLIPVFEGTFKKDYKKCKARGLDVGKIIGVIDDLINEKPLAVKYRNHKLKGKYANYWECHIEPDWIMIYRKDEKNLYIYFVRNGTHSDLFR